MERLTERTAEGIVVKEDYGEEVLKTLYQCFGAEVMPHYANCEEGYCAMERLTAYEDAEEQGFLLRLPCKIGDKLYTVEEWLDTGELSVLEYTFNGIERGGYRLMYADNEEDITVFGFGEIGKTVFLSKEEAEQALKQMGE